MVSALLLAAGRSSRFGAEKLWQRLAGGETVLERSLALALSVTSEVCVVIRADHERLVRELHQDGVRFRVCPDADLGMGHSLAWGVAQTTEREPILVMLADLPFVRPETARAVAGAILSPRDIVVPTYRDERGHPVGFGTGWRPELLALTGDRGAKELLQANRAIVRLLAVQDPAIVQDLDTPQQLALAIAAQQQQQQ